MKFKMFQSPRSGKFVSDLKTRFICQFDKRGSFNPLDRGNLYQIYICNRLLNLNGLEEVFQSPRSGKFVSDVVVSYDGKGSVYSFNPLDRGNLYQIGTQREQTREYSQCFNPLDRGNLYQI